MTIKEVQGKKKPRGLTFSKAPLIPGTTTVSHVTHESTPRVTSLPRYTTRAHTTPIYRFTSDSRVPVRKTRIRGLDAEDMAAACESK